MDSLLSRLGRAARVLTRTGLLQQSLGVGLRGVLKGFRLMVSHPLGPGIIHALHAENFPDRVALETVDRTFTYRELDSLLNRMVHGLFSVGVGRKSRVILMAENGWEYLAGLFAAFRGGFTAVHASYRLKPDELAYQIEHSGAKAVLFSPRCWPTVSEVRRRYADRPLTWIATAPIDDAPELTTLDSLTSSQPDSFPDAGFRGATYRSLVYTSGTTGKPKGAVRDFSSMGVNELAQICERLPVQTEERHLVVCPLYHSGAQAFAVMATSFGSTLVIPPHFDPESALRAMDEQRIDSLFMVPTMVRKVLDLPDGIKARHRPRLSWLLSGAAPFPHGLRMRAIEFFGPVIYDFYGATEMGWVTLCDSDDMRRRPNSVGRAIAGTEIIIADEQGRRLGPGEGGEVYAANSQTIEGYLDDARATDESRLGEAQSAGDLGYLDDEGFLFLAGRAKEMILSGGVNIYPAEIENVLLAHDAVREAAIVGLPDQEWGERVAAFLVGPAAGDRDDLEAFCRERMANFKVPKDWYFLDALPRNPTGKVLKRELRTQHSQ